MTAIDQWIVELNQQRVSVGPQPLISTVDTAVAAIALLGAAVPATVAANLFFAGPASGIPAAPTFRAPVTADLPTTFIASIGNINFNSATVPSNGFRLSSGNTVRGLANGSDVFQWVLGNLSMVNSSVFTPLSTNGIVGTTTNDNANAGSIGEYIEVDIALGSATALTTGSVTTLLTLPLTAGDWDVTLQCGFAGTGGATVTQMVGSTSLVTNTLDTTKGRFAQMNSSFVATNQNYVFSVPERRFSLSAGASIFGVFNSVFSAGALAGFGNLSARRRR